LLLNWVCINLSTNKVPVDLTLGLPKTLLLVMIWYTCQRVNNKCMRRQHTERLLQSKIPRPLCKRGMLLLKNNDWNIIYGTITKLNDKIKLLKYVRSRQNKVYVWIIITNYFYVGIVLLTLRPTLVLSNSIALENK